MATLGIVINPTSGRGRGKADGAAAKVEFAKHGVDLVDLSADSFLAASVNAKKAIQEKTIEGLIVVGGDGMFHLAVNATANTDFPVGLIAAGTGKLKADGEIVPLVVQAGDRVLFSKMAGQTVKVEGEEYLIMREDDIMAIVRQGE